MQLGRIHSNASVFLEKNLSSSALGDNLLKIIQMDGRVLIDLMKVVQRDHKLDTYKLDAVANNFMKGSIKAIDGNVLRLDTINGVQVNSFIKLGNGEKCLVEAMDPVTLMVTLASPPGALGKKEMTWGLAKDDISPKQIFECQTGTDADRALIAKYCIQDCMLCNYLMMKLQILANNFGMANVCTVPLSYIFMRGQGVKIFSLVAKQCNEDGFLIPVIRKTDDEDDGYEGAIVLDPVPGIYIDDPISVLDYASLYPSSMISENISHDSIVLDSKYDNLPGYEYLNITYDQFEGEGDKKHKVGERVCRYAQFPDGEKGIIPRILQKLLVARKTTRKKI
jgi:DNA polymerase elongation subunit (family B)